jgi:hypothetical protein
MPGTPSLALALRITRSGGVFPLAVDLYTADV